MGNEGNASNKANGEKKGFRLSLVARIVLNGLEPMLLLAIVLLIVGIYTIKTGMRQEIINGLEETIIQLDGTMNALDSGDYTLDSQGNLLKGSYNLGTNEDLLDSLVKDTDIEITIFYDKTRRATTLKDSATNERIVGTDAADEVYNQVVKNGEDLDSYNLTINGEPYYACYKPLKNSDGKIVGMYFAGTCVSDVNAFISSKINFLIIIAVVVIIISIGGIAYTAMHMRRAIKKTSNAIAGLAAGDLNAAVEPVILRRSDELGDMAREVDKLQKDLQQVISKVKESAGVLFDAGRDLSSMSSQTSTTADEIGHAVEDISKGAVSQAEEIETASARINEMGELISDIVNGVGTLDTTSAEMKSAGTNATTIVNELSASNDKTMDAIARIGRQVNATNESANKISEAIEIITSIAEETNLLSLNASIEAARAGEQGRGFAVVANQIQKLAEQSNESAQKIAEIIKELLNDSEHTVTVMNEVQEIVNEQQTKLQETKSQFNNVSQGIDASRKETSSIKGQTTRCDAARDNVVDVITNLSAISEENAASTQQTTASMQELNATINLLAESAGKLTDLSDELEKEISFFHF